MPDMNTRGSAPPAKRLGIAWFCLTLALALHVADEALNDFLQFYNPIVESVGLPLPTFTFEKWLAGLIVVVVILLSLSPYAFLGKAFMVPVAVFLGILMVLNGLAHIAVSAYLVRLVPGVYSSPVLLVAAVCLLRETHRYRRGRPSQVPP